MRKKVLIAVILGILNAFCLHTLEANSSSDIFIYGKITTVDDEEYTGQIRWGKEEAFWFDMFNSSKPENDNLDYLSRDEREKLDEKDNHGKKKFWSWSNKWNNNNYYDRDHTHVFACQFGNIKSLKIRGREKITLELKNGETMKLKGGSNDIGEKVWIYDEELGAVKLEWDRIERVDFMPTPASFESNYGAPLYGTVKTDEGSFTGYVQWDHDERLSKDELNGDTKDGELDIEFGKIKKIEKSFRGSKITLNSGRTLELRGSNDVNDENRGIIVNDASFGRVDIQWDEFEEVEFSAAPSSNNGLGYNSFNGDKQIRGTVTTRDGDTYTGKLIYDLDEQYTLEMLNGKNDDIEYFIPFALVKSIAPLNWSKTKVELTTGKSFTLEDKVDVNEDNDGVLVFKGDDDYTYIMWEDIERIELN